MRFSGSRSFGHYFDAADETQRKLREEGGVLLRALENVHDFFPGMIWAKDLPLKPSEAFLSTHAFATWLAACRVALSGHETAVYPVLRTALEAACYAFLVHRDEAAEAIWNGRDKDEAARAACRRIFTPAVSKVAKELSENGEVIAAAYDALIDFGAHPNRRAVLSSLIITELGSEYHVAQPALHSSAAPEITRALFACCDIGMLIASALVAAFLAEDKEAELALGALAELQRNVATSVRRGER